VVEPVKRPAVVKMETDDYSCLTQQLPLPNRETDEYSCVTHHYPSSLDTVPFTTEPPSIPVNQKLLPDVNVKAKHFLQNDTAHADLCVTVSGYNAFIM